MKQKLVKILFLFVLIVNFTSIYAQVEVTQSEITKKKGQVYYEGRPFTGWLLSDQDGINNKCDCTLKAKYKKGKLNGVKQEWYTNGRKKYYGKYVRGYKVGTHKYYYSNGKIKKEETYLKGGVVDKTYYFKSGKKKKFERWEHGELIVSKNLKKASYNDAEINNPNSIVVNSETKADPDEVINNNINVIRMTNDNFDIEPPKLYEGLQKILYSTGNTRRVILYQNALIVKDSTFYVNGNLQLVKNFDNGELIHQEKYNEDGLINQENNYQNNTKHGKQKFYNEKGLLELVEDFENGALVFLTKYFEDGKIYIEENYLDNKKHGTQKEYDKFGKIAFLQEYNSGHIVSEKQYNNGRLFKEVVYNTEGKLKEKRVYNELGGIKFNLRYNNDDVLIEKSEYNDESVPVSSELFNENTGVRVKLLFDNQGNKQVEKAYKDNKLIREGEYNKGLKTGIWTYYSLDGKSEVRKIFVNDKLEKSENIIYARQIKNVTKDGSKIIKYSTKQIGNDGNYYVVKHNCNSNEISNCENDIFIKKIYERIDSFLPTIVSVVSDVQPIKEKMISGELSIYDVRYRFSSKSKSPKNNKFIFYLTFTIKFTDLITGEEEVKNYILPKSSSYRKYYSGKEKAVNNSLEIIDVHPFLQKKCFPRKGSLLKVLEQTENKIYSIIVSFGKNYVEYGDEFFIFENGGTKAKAKVVVKKVFEGQSLLKVSYGEEWLKGYLKTNKNPIVTEKSFSIK